MKYIDADKLIVAIEKRLKNIRDYINGIGMKYKGPKFYKARGKESAYDELLSIIYFLQQEQPEVDLEKEIDKYFSNWGQGASDEGCFNADSQLVSIYDCRRIARHFYELGLNTRNED